MFCQQIAHATSKSTKYGLFRNKCPFTVTKVSIYDDSIKEKVKKKSKKSLTSIYENPEIEPNFFTSILGSIKLKKDWMEDFRRVEFTPVGINKWWELKKRDFDMMTQEFIEQRHQILGSDLAAATFIVYRGGKAKFKGNDEWIQLKEDNTCDLPTHFNPNYVLIALDCSGIQLHFESLMNLTNLNRLKWINFKGNEMFDDWYMDTISAEFPNLEYLDVSNCKNVTERGIESLYRMYNLKQLIVTNYHNSAAFELTCLMLEECNLKLECIILQPDPEQKSNSESLSTSVDTKKK